MAAISTHVLDTVSGRPAAGLAVSLHAQEEEGWQALASGETDADGRIGLLGDAPVGTCRLRFATGEWTVRAGLGASTFPEVIITILVAAADDRLHIPLLLSPHGYVTYRGS